MLPFYVIGSFIHCIQSLKSVKMFPQKAICNVFKSFVVVSLEAVSI